MDGVRPEDDRFIRDGRQTAIINYLEKVIRETADGEGLEYMAYIGSPYGKRYVQVVWEDTSGQTIDVTGYLEWELVKHVVESLEI